MGVSGDMSTNVSAIKYNIWVDENSVDDSANTSSVTVRVSIRRMDSKQTVGTGTIFLKINGTSYTASLTSDDVISSVTHYFMSKTVMINHDLNGTKSLTCSCWISHSAFKSSEQSYTQSLTKIDRSSKVTAPASINMNSIVTLSITRKDTSFLHTVEVMFGSVRETLLSRSTSTSVSWKATLELAEQIPNSASGSGMIQCTTFDSRTGSVIGRTNTPIRLDVPTNIVPVIDSVDYDDTQSMISVVGASIYKYLGYYVRSQSRAKITTTAHGQYGATIKEIKTTIFGEEGTQNPFISNFIAVTGRQNVKVVVTDSRGRTAVHTGEVRVDDYFVPKIDTFTVSRCTSTGQADDSGSFAKVTYSLSYYPIMENTGNFTIEYKKTSESTWHSIKSRGGIYQETSGSEIVSADENSSYNFRMTVGDQFTLAVKQTINLSTGWTLVDYRNTGHGIAFGKASEKDKFECNMDTEFKSVVTFEGTDLDKVGMFNDYSVFEQKSSNIDFLQVNLSGIGGTNNSNKTYRFGFNMSSEHGCVNIPIPASERTGQFIGIREVLFFGSNRVMVKITEFYPKQGRIWTNHFNWSSWEGWHSKY